jgi:ketosteroid isomerase-like protein
MSEEIVELVRRSLEAFARGDFETAFAAHAPDTEWRTASDEPDPQTYRGIDGLHELVDTLTELWTDRFSGQQRFEEFIDRGDWVIVPWTARLQGKGSGVEVLVYETYAVRITRGRIVRVQEYRTREEALEAVARRPNLG